MSKKKRGKQPAQSVDNVDKTKLQDVNVDSEVSETSQSETDKDKLVNRYTALCSAYKREPITGFFIRSLENAVTRDLAIGLLAKYEKFPQYSGKFFHIVEIMRTLKFNLIKDYTLERTGVTKNFPDIPVETDRRSDAVIENVLYIGRIYKAFVAIINERPQASDHLARLQREKAEKARAGKQAETEKNNK